MAQQRFDFDEKWEEVVKGLDMVVKICQGKIVDAQITYQDWSKLYHIVYSWCTRPEEKKKQELYNKVTQFFETVVAVECEALKEKRGDILLKDYLHRFSNYTSATSKIKNIFAYMHRYWIPSQVTNGDNTVRNIYEASLVKWREKAYVPLQSRLLDALLSLVTSDRDGEQVDKTLLSNMVNAYIQIGVNEEQPVHFYKKEFQDPFVKNTKEYYIKESDAFIQANSVSEYMKKGEERLIQEETLAQQYLHPTTKSPLIGACEEVLIERHNHALQDEFRDMLGNDKAEDMRRFYYLLSRITNGLNRSSTTLKNYLTEVGTQIVTEHSKKLTNRQLIKDSVELVHALLALHKKYNDILKRCFSGPQGMDKLFVQAMDEAFMVFINKQVGVFAMAEVLNYYVDVLLKGGEQMTEDQLDEQSENIVKLFVYVDEKDLFYNSFSRSLSKRLLSKKIKEDAEKKFLSMLKVRCGDQFTKKLEGMFFDVKLSSEKYSSDNEAFRDFFRQSDVEFDLSVTVLNHNYWPLKQGTELNLAKEMLPCVDLFRKYYAKENQKKLLTWLYSYGDCLVTHVLLERGKRKKYDLTISCIQTCALLLFNENMKYTFQEICDALGVKEDVLAFSLAPLIYTKIRCLVNRGPDAAGKTRVEGARPTIDSQDVLQLVPMRTEGKIKVAFPPGSPVGNTNTDPGDESAKVNEKTQEDRIWKIQLAVVRVMKARGTLPLQDLILETTKQLIKFFKPDPKMMKKQVESLMERGFLRRDEENSRLMHYCA